MYCSISRSEGLISPSLPVVLKNSLYASSCSSSPVSWHTLRNEYWYRDCPNGSNVQMKIT